MLELKESMIELPAIKVLNENIDVEYAFCILPIESSSSEKLSISEQIDAGMERVELEIQATQAHVDRLDQEINRLTNSADALDNLVAVGSGLLAALIDSLWVGEFDFSRGKAWSNHKVNDFVMQVAKAQGYEGERLDGAIKFLEEKFPVPHDNIWKGKDLGISAKSHHLDDLAHHPTPIGLFFSILTQFTEKGYFQNSEGTFLPIDIDESGKKLIGTNIPAKILCGSVNWFFHLVSDMSGSNKTAGAGMGIPGPIVSLLKEISAIPGFNNTDLAKKLKDVFVNEKFDLRAELAVAHELGRQAVPVLINEVLVRVFYFLRRLVSEIKSKGSFKELEWKNILPWNNRTIVRMLTIATGTFTAADIADAAIRAALKTGGPGNPLFWGQVMLRVNFVGIGRFSIAVYSDVSMGIQRGNMRNDRIAVLSKQLHLMNAKVAYLQASMWQSAIQTEKCLQEAEQMMQQSIVLFVQTWEANRLSLKKIGEMREKIENKNPGLISDIQSALKWGY